MSEASRPCRYCVANWTEITTRHKIPGADPILPSAEDCEFDHRDDPRVYDLATAMARVMQDRNPSDAQIAYFLGDADDVVDDFDPTPDRWRVRKLPESARDHEQGIEARLRINDVTYVALEGGKDSRGSVVKLTEFRSW
ncbi:hypothetical protein EYA84_02140 [Verrucosispora sp. SN26_14.1]|uniref:hypothetical protein n=1 Tax=Verrucosispora sp. SN26_14.1 TaxID=2527879 RepID=UPI0010353256|nr:hypothetical protein [Verrucosispora sp. SN26_14.1]TBL44264.1 hypothetical protein EYA84_02140 [Verrucosispora sp. SN26_14.1]